MSDNVINAIFITVFVFTVIGGLIILIRRAHRENAGLTETKDATFSEARKKTKGKYGIFGMTQDQYDHEETVKDEKFEAEQTMRHVKNASSGKYNFVKRNSERRKQGYAYAIIAAIFFCFFFFLILNSFGVFTDKTPTVLSGQPVPMMGTFKIEKESNEGVINTAQGMPYYDGYLNNVQKQLQCNNADLMIGAPGQGQVIISNISGGKVKVTTPQVFPGMITISCKGNQLLLVAQQ